MTVPTGAQLELLIIAHMHPEDASWPPPDRLRHLVDPLIAAGLLVNENENVRLSPDGEAVIARDARAAAIREELAAMQPRHDFISLVVAGQPYGNLLPRNGRS